MFSVLVFIYMRLARFEECEVLHDFGETCSAYSQRTPAFLPRLRQPVLKGRREA